MDKNKIRVNMTAEDWLDAALQVVAEGGLKALAIEPLAKRMGISKGSFYWHFKNRRALLLELLKFWDSIEIDFQERLLAESNDPETLLISTFTLLVEDDTNKCIFLALSSELKDAEVRAVYEKAVDRRIKLFHDAYVALGMDKKQSAQKAIITFNLYLGLIKSLLDTPEKVPKLSGNSKLMIAVTKLILP